VNGEVVNVPSFSLKPGDVVMVKEGSRERSSIQSMVRAKNPKFSWVEWS